MGSRPKVCKSIQKDLLIFCKRVCMYVCVYVYVFVSAFMCLRSLVQVNIRK